MGWETRHGDKCYLYRNHRDPATGRPVKKYLGAYGGRHGDFTRFVLAHDLARRQQEQSEWRALQRVSWADWRAELAARTAPVDEADGLLKSSAEVLLLAGGYHRPNRGPWRKARGRNVANIVHKLRKRIEALAGLVENAKPGPLVRFTPDPADPEMVAACEKARAGDAAALAALPALIASRGWADGAGNLGRQATYQVIATATGGDPAWREALTQHVAALWESVAGPAPTAVDQLLIRRIVNGWLAVHTLELEAAVRPPKDHRQAAYLDRRIGQAQRRLTDACRALAAVRRRPVVLQVNQAVNQKVIAPGAPT